MGRILIATNRELIAFPELGGEPVVLWESGPELQGPIRAITAGPGATAFGVLEATTITLFPGGAPREVYKTENGIITALTYAYPGHRRLPAERRRPGHLGVADRR